MGLKLTSLKKLNVCRNNKINQINHIVNLKELNASETMISDIDLRNINLKKLNARNSPYITSVNHMTNLKKLDASGYVCGINYNGIRKLNLRKLAITQNNKMFIHHDCYELDDSFGKLQMIEIFIFIIFCLFYYVCPG